MTHSLGKETSQLRLFIDPNQRPDSEMSDLNLPAFTKLHNPEHRQSMDEVYVMSRFVNAQHCFSKELFIHSSTYVGSWRACVYVCMCVCGCGYDEGPEYTLAWTRTTADTMDRVNTVFCSQLVTCSTRRHLQDLYVVSQQTEEMRISKQRLNVQILLMKCTWHRS